MHACQLLQVREKVVFITSDDMRYRGAAIAHAQMDGYRPVLVPQSIGHKLDGLKDAAGNPMRYLGAYVKEWNESFEFKWVDPADLTKAERAVWATLKPLKKLASDYTERVVEVSISQTMRMNETAA